MGRDASVPSSARGEILLHTSGHLDCPACERLRDGKVLGSDFGLLYFKEAANFWLAGRRSISAGTVRDYKNCLKPLTKFFGELRLREIHIGHLQSYQDERRKVVGPVRINRELGVVLGGILDRAGLWESVSKFYESLPLPKKRRGIALEPEEERYLWKLAAGNYRWKVAYWCSILARNTCLGTNEVRTLRLGSIDQKDYRWVRIDENLKNEFRERTLRCNTDASWALQQLAERAARMGAYLPEHFLLPHRSTIGKHRKADPAQPMASFLWSWRKLRAEVAKKYPHLAALRFYDNRHTACTRLLENPEVPYNAIEHMMGHEINSRTKRIYDHIRDSTLQTAADALSSGHFEQATRDIVMVERKPPVAVKKAG